MEAHKFKVAMAADLVALWHNGRITVDARTEEISAAAHARSVAASQVLAIAAGAVGVNAGIPSGRA